MLNLSKTLILLFQIAVNQRIFREYKVKMVLKASFKIAFLVIELILTFYSEVLRDSLMVKFLFFVITAVLIAMGVTELAKKLLPTDKDYISEEEKINS